MAFSYELMDPVSTYNIIQAGGVAALLIVILFGGLKKWWVFGWQYRQVEESNIKWMELALRSTNLIETLEDIEKRRPPDLPK